MDDEPLQLQELLNANPEIRIFGHTQCSETWSLMPRSLPEDLIYVVEDGCCGGRIASRPFQCQAGGAFWIPAGHHHELFAVKGLAPPRMYNLRFVNPVSPPEPTFVAQAHGAHQRMADLHREWQHQGPYHGYRIRSALVLLLTTLLLEEHGGAGGLTQQQQRQVFRCVALQPAHGRLDSTDLAQAAGLSVDWFIRQFKKTFGMSPRTWLKHQRLQRAAARLADTNVPISQIAEEFGYAELFRFSRQFREVFAMSPREWRRQRGAPGNLAGFRERRKR